MGVNCKSEKKDRSPRIEKAVREWKDKHGGFIFEEERVEDKGWSGNGWLNETDTYDDMLRICWMKQECWSCIGTSSRGGDEGHGNGREVGCSWCPSVCLSSYSWVTIILDY